MTNDWKKDRTNYVIFFMFIILVPILLINLLIGLATGELKYILDESAVMQFQLRLKFVLGMQDLILFKLRLYKMFNKKFLFDIYEKDISKQRKKDIYYIEKTEKNAEKSLTKLEMRQAEQYNLFVARFSYNNEICSKMLEYKVYKKT
jgi:hypothetical protein